jgi:hypothetical protein
MDKTNFQFHILNSQEFKSIFLNLKYFKHPNREAESIIQRC